MMTTTARFAISFAGTILAAAQASAYEVPEYNPEYWNDSSCVQWMNNCYNYAMNKATHTFAQPGIAHECSLAPEKCRSAPEECDLSYERNDAPLRPPEGSLTGAFEICDYVAWYAAMDGAVEPISAPPSDPKSESGPSLSSEADDAGVCGGGPGYTKVALVIRSDFKGNDGDYHWYRRDNNGKWSHKLAGTPATNLDGCGNEITDPAKLIADSTKPINPEEPNTDPEKDCQATSYDTFCGYYCTASTSKEQGTGTMVIN